MSMFLGPLDAAGRVPPRQQTRVAAFLLSCHGAMARQLALAQSWQMNPAWHAELNAQLFHEAEIVALLPRATSWTIDPELLFLLPGWETSWLPMPGDGFADRTQAMTIDVVAFGHALHSVVRPAALLPQDAAAQDPFAPPTPPPAPPHRCPEVLLWRCHYRNWPAPAPSASLLARRIPLCC